jgi:hypothetical protein
VLDNSQRGLLRDNITDNGMYVLVPRTGNLNELKILIENIFVLNSQSLPAINLVVLNGTKIEGWATETTGYLESLGFDAVDTIAIAADGIATLSVANANKLVAGDIISVESSGLKYEVILAGAGTTLTLDARGVITVLNATADVMVERPVNKARKLKTFELIWTPPLSVFKLQSALPGGNFEIVLVPQPGMTFQQYGVETLVNKTPNTDYKLSIEDMYFYCNVVDGKRADDITYLLDLDATACQSDNIKTTSLQQRNFDVSPSTYALTVAYQDLRVGQDTRFSSSKFRSYDVSGENNTELALNRFYLSFAGSQHPSPDSDTNFDVTADKTTQRYAETQLYSGAFFDNGGCETIEEYHARGSYYYFAIPRDGSDKSTQVVVNQQFKTATSVENMRALLFSHYKQVARISVSDSRVVSVSLEDA